MPFLHERPTIGPDLARQVIGALYRQILGREPDPGGLAAWTAELLRTGDPDKTLAAFLECDEYRQVRHAAVWRSATSVERLPGILDVDLPTLRRLFDLSARYWRTVGDDPAEVYYSVLTSPRNRAAIDDDRARAFIIKGGATYAPIHDRMAALGRVPPAEASAVEFGCGVGRLAIHAARRFARLAAADVSSGHLRELERNIRLVDPALSGRIDPIRLDTLDSVQALPPADYLYSVITLQHVPPPLMAHLVRVLLDRLNPGGVAALHVPVHHPFYRFDLTEYLADERAGSAMEMHILPREDLRSCVEQVGCVIRDSCGTSYTKGIYSEVFLITKP